MSDNNIYSLLAQTGPFAIGSHPPDLNPFSREGRVFASGVSAANMATKYRTVRNQLFEFLDVRSFAEIDELVNDPVRRQAVNRRAYGLLGNMFGIEGNEREVVLRINEYSRTADGVINYLKTVFSINQVPASDCDSISL